MSVSIYSNGRRSSRPIDPIFLDRWSPRSFSPDEISEEELMVILDAARWAPSSFNVQPWRYIYARRGTPYWERFVDLLMEFNRVWAAKAAALLYIVSDTQAQDKSGSWVFSRSHSFDAGASWAFLALQATMRGWQAHAMTGIHVEKVHEVLRIPDFYRVEAGVAIGKVGPPNALPEKLRVRESPSQRRPLEETVFEGLFRVFPSERERDQAGGRG